MKIENIEKCKMLMDKMSKLQSAADLLDGGDASLAIVQGFGNNMRSTDLLEAELNAIVQDAISERIRLIEKQLEQL